MEEIRRSGTIHYLDIVNKVGTALKKKDAQERIEALTQQLYSCTLEELENLKKEVDASQPRLENFQFSGNLLDSAQDLYKQNLANELIKSTLQNKPALMKLETCTKLIEKGRFEEALLVAKEMKADDRGHAEVFIVLAEHFITVDIKKAAEIIEEMPENNAKKKLRLNLEIQKGFTEDIKYGVLVSMMEIAIKGTNLEEGMKMIVAKLNPLSLQKLKDLQSESKKCVDVHVAKTSEVYGYLIQRGVVDPNSPDTTYEALTNTLIKRVCEVKKSVEIKNLLNQKKSAEALKMAETLPHEPNDKNISLTISAYESIFQFHFSKGDQQAAVSIIKKMPTSNEKANLAVQLMQANVQDTLDAIRPFSSDLPSKEAIQQIFQIEQIKEKARFERLAPLDIKQLKEKLEQTQRELKNYRQILENQKNTSSESSLKTTIDMISDLNNESIMISIIIQRKNERPF